MKINANAADAFASKKSLNVILPLVPIEVHYTKEQMMSFRLRSDPAVADSPTYDMYVPCLQGTEDLRTCLTFIQNITKICAGMNVNAAPNKHAMTLRLLKDSATTAYQAGIDGCHQQRYNERVALAYEARIAAGDQPDVAGPASLLTAADAYSELDYAAGITGLLMYMCPQKGSVTREDSPASTHSKARGYDYPRVLQSLDPYQQHGVKDVASLF